MEHFELLNLEAIERPEGSEPLEHIEPLNY
jgi:hypothetical protein